MSKYTAEEETLMLWKKLSETPTQFIKDQNVADFKNSILKELGIGERMFGCPLCEKYNSDGEDNNCPLGKCVISIKKRQPCFSTPYHTWLEKIIHNDTHDQELAKAFYEYLLMKFK